MFAQNWIRHFHPRPESNVRLVCLPHAGGAASYFFRLSAAMPAAVEVHAVQYPGRQDRRHEPLIDDISQLADEIFTVLRSAVAGPLALFGHSMGAVVAFELARRLRDTGDHGPVALFVSGRRAPSRIRQEDVHLRSDAGLIAEMRRVGGTDPRVLLDRELLEVVLPVTRNDYRAIETYRVTPGEPLECPVTAFVGRSDPRVTPEEVDAWREHTTGKFEMHVCPGGHFYLDQCQPFVTGTVEAELCSAL
jgi:pyochelin biosynthetic protein PchC